MLILLLARLKLPYSHAVSVSPRLSCHHVSSRTHTHTHTLQTQPQAIVAMPLTVTGSIGVVAGKFNLGELYERAGYSKTLLSRGKFAELAADNRWGLVVWVIVWL